MIQNLKKHNTKILIHRSLVLRNKNTRIKPTHFFLWQKRPHPTRLCSKLFGLYSLAESRMIDDSTRVSRKALKIIKPNDIFFFLNYLYTFIGPTGKSNLGEQMSTNLDWQSHSPFYWVIKSVNSFDFFHPTWRTGWLAVGPMLMTFNRLIILIIQLI